jgi:hypothetical protein
MQEEYERLLALIVEARDEGKISVITSVVMVSIVQAGANHSDEASEIALETLKELDAAFKEAAINNANKMLEYLDSEIGDDSDGNLH